MELSSTISRFSLELLVFLCLSLIGETTKESNKQMNLPTLYHSMLGVLDEYAPGRWRSINGFTKLYEQLSSTVINRR